MTNEELIKTVIELAKSVEHRLNDEKSPGLSSSNKKINKDFRAGYFAGYHRAMRTILLLLRGDINEIR